MKINLYILAGAMVLAACGDSTTKSNVPADNQTEVKAPESAEPTIDPAAIENPKTADNPTANSADLPVLAFEKESHEFQQRITEGESVSYSFKFTNTGKSDLIISDASAPCGCTIPSYSKEPIPPGGEGKIDVQYNSEGKGGGLHEKHITVTSNSIPKKRTLKIMVNVDPKQ